MWQRRQRPNLGDIAQRWGWLDEGAIRYILGFREMGRRFGEKAVGLDLLTQRQLQTLLFSAVPAEKTRTVFCGKSRAESRGNGTTCKRASRTQSPLRKRF